MAASTEVPLKVLNLAPLNSMLMLSGPGGHSPLTSNAHQSMAELEEKEDPDLISQPRLLFELGCLWSDLIWPSINQPDTHLQNIEVSGSDWNHVRVVSTSFNLSCFLVAVRSLR